MGYDGNGNEYGRVMKSSIRGWSRGYRTLIEV